MRIQHLLLAAQVILPVWLVSAEPHPGQYAGGCALVSKRIYCYGGTSTAIDFSEYKPNGDFFSLDVSGPVTRVGNATSWQRVTAVGDTRPTVNMWFGMASLPNKDVFVMAGGVGYALGDPAAYPSLMYNATSSSWSALSSPSFLQTQMNTLMADVQSQDRFLIYGGRRDHTTGYSNVSEGETYPATIQSLSLTDLTWAPVPNQNAVDNTVVSGRIRHAGAQGKDGRFYILGGEFSSSQYNETTNFTSYTLTPADMSQILAYDMTKGWQTMQIASGPVPSKRWHNTATLLNSGNILMYGGAETAVYVGINNTYLNPVVDVAFLFNTESMTWSDMTSAIQPKDGGDSLDKQQYRRYGHSAVLVGNDSLFILFGKSISGSYADGFLILNTTSWVLSNSFAGLDAPATVSDGSDSQIGAGNNDGSMFGGDSGGLAGGAIAGIVVGVVAGIGLIAGAGVFVFLRRRREEQLRLPDDDVKDGSADSPAPPYTPMAAIKPESTDTVPRLSLVPVKPDGA